MKKFSIFLVIFALVFNVYPQATNSKGELLSMGNVWIVVNVNSYNFTNGQYTYIEGHNEVVSQLQSVLFAKAVQVVQDEAYVVVNRDPDMYNKVKDVIETNHLEDYLKGYSVQAKNQGADYMLIVDAMLHTENNMVAQVEYHCRMIGIATNIGAGTTLQGGIIHLDKSTIREEIASDVEKFSSFFRNFVLSVAPHQFGIKKVEGKNCYLQSYGPFKSLNPDDQFTFYYLDNQTMQIAGEQTRIQVLYPIAHGKYNFVEDGCLKISTDVDLSKEKGIVAMQSFVPVRVGTPTMTASYIPLQYDLKNYSGCYAKHINNAVVNALSLRNGMAYIETEHMKLIQSERELQKNEDFMNGHIVQQMIAAGVSIMIFVTNYSATQTTVTFDLTLVNTQGNSIVKTQHFSNLKIAEIDQAIANVFSDVAWVPCRIDVIDNKHVNIYSYGTINCNNDAIFTIWTTQQVQQRGGQVAYNRIYPCKLKLLAKRGQMLECEVSEIVDQSIFSNIENYVEQDFYYAEVSPVNNSKYISKKQETVSLDIIKAVRKAERKENSKRGFQNFLNGAANVIKGAAKNVNVKVQPH